MKYVLILVLTGLACVALGYFALGYLSSYVGWYGYKKWECRRGTHDINESKKRGVFIRELQFKIDSFEGDIGGFRPYIERGFKYGLHSSKETIPLKNSNYPYQLSFNFKASSKLSFFIKDSELKKFDSANIVRGYLEHPYLKDTIEINLNGENIHSGIIKVW
jgi:hypothetical protein